MAALAIDINALIEVAVPGIYGSAARKQAAILRRKLEAYFRKIEKSFPTARTLAIYRQHLEPREAVSPIEKELMLIYTDWAEKNRPMLEAALQDSIAQSSRDGFTGSMDEWVDRYKLKPPPAGLDVPIPKSLIAWTKKHSATAVTGINKETARRMAATIARGLKEQRDIAGIGRMIRGEFADMTKYRSNLIAVTETNTAFSRGNFQAAQEVGSKEKKWIDTGLENVCEVCQMNAAEGRISMDEEFPSGHEHPPAHPGCHCDVAYFGATKTSVANVIA